MALKKSELYSSLWQSCDELRGGMDASQYKDYVLSLLFIKYVSDKYDGQPYSPIKIPKGASFKAMVALKGTTDIGDQINKRVIAPLAKANKQLSQSDFPDFNDSVKLGDGKEKVERLTNLIAIFEGKALDFSKNRADGDDILGDAYEYLIRHFATESGKSKGQFYTPAEVSRIMAQIIGIHNAKTNSATTVYDPTCGSGSLLLKVADEATSKVTLYGQEKDATTSGLARMNMILHNNPTAAIAQGNTLSLPEFTDNDVLKTFDYVVANPPFSDKRWSTGLDPLNDPHERFKAFGVPPSKQGDYAYLLHIVRSLKSTGTGACILPHGVLFRGNAEADIRQKLVRKGYIKGIIGLPANLFYGTGIPACIVVIDKKKAKGRKAIFMLDASEGFIKEGPKNRLRAQDIHKMVDVFNRQEEIAGYSKIVSFAEIEKNEYNLNLPRYIDSREAEDLHDIAGHLQGGIPTVDVDSLQAYWDVCPGLRKALFKRGRKGYVDLRVDQADIKTAIYEHPEFVTFVEQMNEHFDKWEKKTTKRLKALKVDCKPKPTIDELSEGLLKHYTGKPLLSRYAVYQHLMDYWADAMQDDVYQIVAEGWKAETYRVLVKQKNGKEKDKGWACDLVPKPLVVAKYFAEEHLAIEKLDAVLDTATAALSETDEEHSGDEGALRTVSKKADAVEARQEAILAAWEELTPESFAEYQEALAIQNVASNKISKMLEDPRLQALCNARGKVNKTSVEKQASDTSDAKEEKFLNRYLKALDDLSSAKKKSKKFYKAAEAMLTNRLEETPDDEALTELRIINLYLAITEQIAVLKKRAKDAEAELDTLVYAKYPELTEREVQTLVVKDKWLATLDADVHGEMDRISQSLTQRVKELAERYGTPLPELSDRVEELEDKVNGHLKRMDFSVEGLLVGVGS